MFYKGGACIIAFTLSSAISTYFKSTHRTSRSQSTHLQEPFEWFGHDLQVLFVKLEQILHLKVDCSAFSPVRSAQGQFTLGTYLPTHYFWGKNYKHVQQNILNLLAYNLSMFDNFCKGGSVPLPNTCSTKMLFYSLSNANLKIGKKSE